MEEQGKVYDIKTMIMYEHFDDKVYKDLPLYACLVIITKVGRKYLHYKYLRDDMQPMETEEFKINKMFVDIFDDKREDIINKVKEIKEARMKWEEDKMNYRRQLEYEMNKIISEKLEEWDNKNPYPKFEL